MESGSRFTPAEDFKLDSKWLVDPNLLFVGPKIGEGAHAKVYEGKYKNQTVAIKIVHKGETAEEITKRESRFAREVTMLSKVQHKNLVKFIGACKEPMMVIVTELLSGGTLRKYLLNMRPRCLETRVAIGFALDIARAMECLHAHGIIHRDLKPENLLLTADHKTVKLADFGLAREESLTEMMTAETGTYRWMAPELYSTVTLRQGDKKHYNHKVDAYSFAIVLWELLHNKLPFEGMSNLQAAYAAAFKVLPQYKAHCVGLYHLTEVHCPDPHQPPPSVLPSAFTDSVTIPLLPSSMRSHQRNLPNPSFILQDPLQSLKLSKKVGLEIHFAQAVGIGRGWPGYVVKNVRPSAENLPEELAIILTSCWQEDPNTRPNFTQIIQMLLNYLSAVCPPEPMIPPRIFTSENTILPPESPGTSSLMASRENPKATMQNKPRGFFFCFSQCY